MGPALFGAQFAIFFKVGPRQIELCCGSICFFSFGDFNVQLGCGVMMRFGVACGEKRGQDAKILNRVMLLSMVLVERNVAVHTLRACNCCSISF